MSKCKPIENVIIDDDTTLLESIQNLCIEKNIKFISESTSKDILALKKDVDLHYQISELNKIWEGLIVDAISFLKYNDSREKYHDGMTLGTKNLADFLNKFQQDFEPILYGAVNNYRDHVAHVFRVYLLGQYLIKNAIGFDQISFGNVLKSDTVSVEEKEAMWCIIALTHDLGTAFEKIHEINKKVRGMLHQFGNITVQELGYSYFTQYGSFSEFVIKFISSDIAKFGNDGDNQFTTHIQSKFYQKYLAALGNFNHGIMSSIILMKELVFFKESDYKLDQAKFLDQEDARQFMIRREILRAVASHSCDDIYYLKINNFSFLLTVCDEMQEWGRPRLVDVLKRGESSTKLTINHFDGKIVDYKVTFNFKQKASQQEKDNAKQEIIRYCIAKRNKWQNVLRSAVGGTDRDLVLNFVVEDNTTSEVKSYSLTHPNPKDAKSEPPNSELVKLSNPKKE